MHVTNSAYAHSNFGVSLLSIVDKFISDSSTMRVIILEELCWRILIGFVVISLNIFPGFSHQVSDLPLVSSHSHTIGEMIQKDPATLDHLEGTRNDETDALDDNDFVSTPEQALGADWIFTSPGGNLDQPSDQWVRAKRAFGLNFGEGTNLQTGGNNSEQLFSAKRYCGFSPKVDPSRLSNAAPGQFPWSAAIISNDNKFLCSGSLISESIILTTASCVLRYRSLSSQPLKVILGAWSLPDGYEYLPELELFVSAAVLHPNFNQNLAIQSNVQNNIALLRLVQNVDFDLYPHIFPICIIGATLGEQAATTKCEVLGWPDLPEMETWRTRAYLRSSEIQLVKQGCSAHPQAGPCCQGLACIGNEGSVIQCLADSNRYYQWGMLVNEPRCDRGASVTLSIVNVIEQYDFIAQYLLTPNPNLQKSTSKS